MSGHLRRLPLKGGGGEDAVARARCIEAHYALHGGGGGHFVLETFLKPRTAPTTHACKLFRVLGS